MKKRLAVLLLLIVALVTYVLYAVAENLNDKDENISETEASAPEKPETITMFAADKAEWRLFEGGGEAANIMPYGTFTFGDNFVNPCDEAIGALSKNKVGKITGKNVLNPDTLTEGVLNTAAGDIAANSAYHTTDFIPVKAGEPISFTSTARKYLAYDATKKPIASTFSENGAANFTFTPTVDGYIRYSVLNTLLGSAMATYTAAPDYEYEAFCYKLENSVRLNDTQLAQVGAGAGNVLYGKKWVACGDSFTSGGSVEADNVFNDGGLYDGEYKVYPFWIGRRNNMTVINEAVSGSTITHIAGRSDAFADGRYKNIADDADYITLRFGINDDAGHLNVPIGTIDDTANTTFYGAWNTVLEYLIENHPWAKIGIIISNGMQTDEAYPNAVRAAARKWGIPYLDIDNDDHVPLMHRTNKDYVCERAKTLRFNNFVVGTNDSHPSWRAHEYESTFIEHWLRSL